MKYQNDPEGLRLPVKLDTTTNGEFAPVPLEAGASHAQSPRAGRSDGQNAKRLGHRPPRASSFRRAAWRRTLARV